MNRPQPPLKGLDLNLLVTLRALLRVGSVTQAAEALGQTQPTVSRALATLRVAFDDPLLVRAGRGMARTPLAQAIWPRLEATLEVVDHLPEVGGFDPGSAVRTWRVVVPDMVAMPLQPVLLARMQVMAPRVALHFLAPGDAAGLLLAHQADLAVGPALDRPEIVTEALPPCGAGWSVLLRSAHPLARGVLTMKRWLACRHVEVEAAGSGAASPLGVVLEAHGLERSVQATLPTLSALAELLAHTELVASLPTPVAARLAHDARLLIRPHPFGEHLVPLRVSLAWHALYEEDAGHRWFRGQVRRLLEELLEVNPPRSA